MNDLKFDHTESDTAKAMGVKLVDLKRFMLDLEEYMSEGKKDHHTHALEFIWDADQSFEMKILATFTVGGLATKEMMSGSPMVLKAKLEDLPPGLQDFIRKMENDDRD